MSARSDGHESHEPFGSAAPAAPPDVLLVEDDEGVRDALKAMLESHGLTVRDYPSGAALFLAERPPRAGCFVVDYHLPGMDGLDVLARLRGEGSGSPSVLITGRIKMIERLRATTDAVAVLEKPFEATSLLRLVNAALGRSGPVPT